MLAATWGAIALIAAGLAYRWRHRGLSLSVLIVLTTVASVLAVVVTGRTAPGLVVSAAKILVGTALLSIIAALLVRNALPGLVSRRDRIPAVLVCGFLAVGYLTNAALLTMAADDQLQVGGLPQVRTRAQFISQRDAPVLPGGVLMQAAVSDHNPESADGVVASLSCPTVGSIRLPASTHRLPDRYLLDFPDGPPVVVAGIDSARQTWGWPSDDAGLCVLRHAAPVVVWGILSRNMGTSEATSRTGLADTRMIAAGDITSFLNGYVPVAHRTARAVLGWAALNVVLAGVMVAAGAKTYVRLTRSGTDAPPRITWRSR